MKLSVTAICLAVNVLGFGGAWAQSAPADSPAIRWAPEAKPSVMWPQGAHPVETSSAAPKIPPTQDQHLADPVLMGAIDLHAYFGPDPYARSRDAFEIAKHSAQSGIRAMVFTSQWSETASLAYLVRKYAGGGDFQAFGSIVLNNTVGGINPKAVRSFIGMEGHYGRIVSMPTVDSEEQTRSTNVAHPFVRVSDNGVLLPQVLEVLDVIKESNLTLATGQISAAEMLLVMTAARQRGIDRIIITHPSLDPHITEATMDQLKQAVALGGSLEIVPSDFVAPARKTKILAVIRESGPQHVFVSSNSGSAGTPYHSDAIVMSIKALREAGYSESDLDLMFRKNPARLIGLVN